ncbi:MAG: hypothetical protein U0931_31280 [Vulcanimicrobiota bacterium]
MMISPTLRKVADRLCHPLKEGWRRESEDVAYEAAYSLEKFAHSPDPSTSGLAKLGQSFYNKFKSNEIRDTQALTGITQALETGLPAGPVSVAIATVGQNILGQIMKGRQAKYGGFSDTLKMANSFVQAAAAGAGQGPQLLRATAINRAGLMSEYNQIVLAQNSLKLLGQADERLTQDQTTALLARNVVQDEKFALGDIDALAVPVLQHLAAHSEVDSVKQIASQALSDFQSRQQLAFKQADEQPVWVESYASLRRLDRENEEKLIPALEQCFVASGPASLPQGHNPEHRPTQSCESIAQARSYLRN